jgi:hypothetical protein
MTQHPLLSVYPKGLKMRTQMDNCTPVFIAVLFTIAKIWEKAPNVHQ